MIIMGMNKIDKVFLQYASDNACSDHVLQRAFDEYISTQGRDYQLISVGLFFTIASLVITLIACIRLSPFRDFVAKNNARYASWKVPTKGDELLSAMGVALKRRCCCCCK